MDRLQQLVREIHRRSLWQVLSIYLLGSWGALQVVESLTESAGLPDWVPSFALVLLVIGLPIVLATAFVQEGVGAATATADGGSGETEAAEGPARTREPAAGGGARSGSPAAAGASGAPASHVAEGDEAGLRHRLFTWRNAIVGGVLAFALLGVVVTGYFVMWSAGIGPVGSLVAQGLIDDGERVVLATFGDATGEGLGDAVTEALRVDLAESSVLQLVEEADVEPVLARMQLEDGTRLTAELAREVAVREGIKAYLEGEVAAAGTGYLVTATLRAADGGRAIASFRVTADGPDRIIASIDKLSQDIRAKSGESLRSIRAGEPLERVTTRSTDALRLFTEADRAFVRGDYRRTLDLLDQAVALDTAFAMAWRKMAATLNNTGTDEARHRLAATRAFEHRERLTERERYLAEAYYYGLIEQDRARTIAAYSDVLRVAPDDRAALNNLANEYQAIEDFERARELYRRAVDGPGRSNTAYQNLIRNRIGAGDFAGALEVYREYEAAFPEDAYLPEARFWAAYINGDLETARAAVEPLTDDPAQPAFVRARALDRMGQVAYRLGRLDEGRRHFLAAERVGAQAGPGYALTRRQWTAYSEFAVGDPEWAYRHARQALDDGTWASLGPAERNHFFVGLNMAVAGDRERAGRIIADYEAAVPEEERGEETRTDLTRLRIFVDATAGTGQGTLERMREMAAAAGCATCWVAEEAYVAEVTGRVEEAIRLHERVRRRGFGFFELNGPYRLRSTFALGPLYEEAGDTAGAIEAYRRVEELWGETADARGMEKVEEARARIAALGGGAG